MRNLSANAIAKIASKDGNEPITIVEIDWIEDAGAKSYSDRTIGGIQGKIQEVSDLDNVINVSNSDSSQELSLTLDDTDGTIKAILDTNDIHKRSARVYQWFEGMDLADKFLLFAGKVSTPIVWDGKERTVAFTIISQLEDKEIGFSAEEGDFPWIPSSLLDKAWPLIFGKVLDSPCLQFNHAVTGTTLCGVGIISGEDAHRNAPHGGNDSAFYVQMMSMWAQIQHAFDCAAALCGGEKYKEQRVSYREQAHDMIKQRDEQEYEHWKQQECARLQREITLQKAISEHDGNGLGCNPIRILGGEDFPQEKGIKIRIGQGIFTGYFEGANFHITDRLHEVKEAEAEKKGRELWGDNWKGFYLEKEWEDLCAPLPPYAAWNFETKLPCTNLFWGNPVKLIGSATGTLSDDETGSRQDQIAQHYWADGGSSVSIAETEPITYVASIVPGTVMAIKAYKTFEGERILATLPTDLYTVETVNYGVVTAVQITIENPLSTIPEQGWEDDLYVTFESDIGPHTCDILQYIIDTYTDLTYDSTSFTAIRSKLDPFPMNFPVLDKKSTLEVLQEIAFQARCALWISNGVFYIKYLPEIPTVDSTIVESDLDAEEGIEVELTATEDLVTKMIVEWRVNWSEDEPDKVILRHNVKKYGTQTEDFFFYCYNQPDIVLKVATFWLIRKANTWKKIRFTTYWNKLALETFDTVLLDFNTDYISTGDIRAIVEEATYNSDSQTINFTCLTPIKAGKMIMYEGFWPSQLSVDWEFPTPEERAAGFAGGDGFGTGAEGDLPIGYTNRDDWGTGVIWVGGPNIVFTGPADYGDSSPTDVGFVAKEVTAQEFYAQVSNSSNPNPNLALNYRKDTALRPLPDQRGVLPYIDLDDTAVIDSKVTGGEPKSATLRTFFKSISEGEKLVVDCDESKWTSSEVGEEDTEGKEFHFKFDEDGDKIGVGTAWLKDDE